MHSTNKTRHYLYMLLMQCVEMLCEQVTTAFGFTSNGMTEWLELLLSQSRSLYQLKANANQLLRSWRKLLYLKY